MSSLCSLGKCRIKNIVEIIITIKKKKKKKRERRIYIDFAASASVCMNLCTDFLKLNRFPKVMLKCCIFFSAIDKWREFSKREWTANPWVWSRHLPATFFFQAYVKINISRKNNLAFVICINTFNWGALFLKKTFNLWEWYKSWEPIESLEFLITRRFANKY